MKTKLFVDNAFVIMKTNEVNRFLYHLDHVDLNINVTIEPEQDDKLAGLNVLVIRNRNGKLATKVYRKTTPQQNHQIKVEAKPLRTVGNMLPSLRDKINKFDQRSIAYQIPCLDCADVYIGKSG